MKTKTRIWQISIFLILILILTLPGQLISIPIHAGNGHQVYRIGVQDKTNYEDLVKWQDKVPMEIQDAFAKEGLKVIYQGAFQVARKTNGTSVGFTEFTKEVVDLDAICRGIYIRNDGKYEDDINFTTSHEFGHYFDYLRGWISLSDEWKTITAEEYRHSQSGYVEAEDGTYYYENPSEFFAEEFAYYVMGGVDGEYEADCCPKAQAYIERTIEEYKEEKY